MRDGALLTGEARTEALIAALAKAGVAQAGFFVTTQNLRDHSAAARLRSYVEAGHVLGNHSHSHTWLSRNEVADYLADLDHAESLLAKFGGRRPWFRFPFLDEGRDPERRDRLREALAERGLRNAYITVDNYDWYLAARADRAAAAGQMINNEALGQLYVDMLVASVDFYEGIAREALGRSPAHVLLLHENDLAALFVADLVAALRERDWQIIDIDEAYADPIAAMQPDTVFNGQGRVAAIAAAAGRPRSELVHAAEDEAWIDAELLRREVFAKMPMPR
jgi:peptidoglycan/xylan/chitin deacetylase (PgdA/CDA1 family)